MFEFAGPVASSKSWLNRALVIQHYNKSLRIVSSTMAEDVKYLEQALTDLINGKSEFHLGAGGTTFRFFAFLISKIPGTWNLTMHPQLLARPQSDLLMILNQLNVQVKLQANSIEIDSTGWQLGKVIHCRGDVSSQFISGLMLNAWQLAENLNIEIVKPLVSAEYLEMTLKLLRIAGMEIQRTESENLLSLSVEKNQNPRSEVLIAEPDVSSAFSLAGAAVIGGRIRIDNWFPGASQPDLIFLEIFKQMKINFLESDSILAVEKQKSWIGINANLKDSPDLFPVLSILCALADGESYLHGASHLRSKESDRIAKTAELLSLCGIKNSRESDGLRIIGNSSVFIKKTSVTFDPDNDHRMAMAAGLLKLAGFNINVLHANVVQKSYPKFWQDIQVIP